MSTSSAYEMRLHGGCGTTSVKLNIDKDRFVLYCFNHWMGSDKTEFELTGFIKNNSCNMSTLYTECLLDKVTNKTIDYKDENLHRDPDSKLALRMIKVGQKIEVDDHDIAFEGMVMGGCDFNRNGTYDVILISCSGKEFSCCEDDQYTKCLKYVLLKSK